MNQARGTAFMWEKSIVTYGFWLIEVKGMYVYNICTQEGEGLRH